MALWMAWATMACLIQLPLPALKICSVYNPFPSRFPFPVTFHCCNVYRFNSLHTIPPLLPPGDTYTKQLAFIRI